MTIALANNPGGATLSGALTVNTVQGVATFSNLSVDQIGTGYTLRVSAANLPAEISAPFNIIVAANQLVFTVQPTSTPSAVAIAPPIQVAIRDSAGNPTTSTALVQLQILNNPGGGTLTGTTTVAAVNGVATFANLAITLPGEGYTLQATSPGLTPVTSQAFDIIAAANNQLVFLVQPTSTPRALTIAPPIQVAIRDSAGNPTTSTAPVQLQILNNPGGGTLTGTATVAAVNGVATFANLAITLPGAGYTLQATSPGVTSATSQPFDIVVPPPTESTSVLNTDFASFGRAGMRGGNGTGTIVVTGISGPVTRALLFWNGPSNSSDPAANAAVSFGGNPITGVNSGFANSQLLALCQHAVIPRGCDGAGHRQRHLRPCRLRQGRPAGCRHERRVARDLLQRREHGEQPRRVSAQYQRLEHRPGGIRRRELEHVDQRRHLRRRNGSTAAARRRWSGLK